MKQQVFWTGLEYTCRLLGITTAAGKTLPPTPAPEHGAQHTGLPKGLAPAMEVGRNTWPHLHLLPSNPRNGSSGQGQMQLGEPGAGIQGHGTESRLGHPPSM